MSTPRVVRSGGMRGTASSVEVSRRDRALKIWMSVQIFGMAAFWAAVAKGIELGERAARHVADSPVLELMTPASLGIVCFRVNPDGGELGDRALHQINRNVLARVFWEIAHAFRRPNPRARASRDRPGHADYVGVPADAGRKRDLTTES